MEKSFDLSFVTSSDAKFREAQEVFPHLKRIKLDLPEIQSDDQVEILRAKLDSAVTTGLDRVMVEDTSLELHCLGGFPGPFIKFFEKRLGAAGLYEIANKLEDLRARAVARVACSIAGQVFEARGEINGYLVAPRGSKGFGFDPIFVPEGRNETFAEMSDENRSRVRHRSLAMRQLRSALEQAFGEQR